MRYATTAESQVLAGTAYSVAFRVQIGDGDGVLQDRTGWVETIEVDIDVDQPVSQATVEFRRDSGALSLSPLRSDSTLNRNSINAYAPAIDSGRAIVISLATTALGTAPQLSDYKEIFRGTLDKVAWPKTPLSVTARDMGGVYVDRYVEGKQTYGSTEGTPLETVIQQIINNWADGRTLSVPVSPNYAIAPAFSQDVSTVMDAIQRLSSLRGWDVRDKWDQGTSSWRPTLFGPDRDKTVPDLVVSASRYLDVTDLTIDRLNVRNAIVVEWTDSTTKATASTIALDTDSINEYGRRWFKITESSDSPINTRDEAQVEADAALADLKDPKADHAIEMHVDWRVELGDLIRFQANGIHYDTDQDLAVVSVRHKLSRTKHRTTVACRGKPASRYLGWFARKSTPIIDNLALLYNQCVASVVSSTATTITIQVTASAPSGATPSVQLVNVTGSATVLSGPAPGVACTSGQQWVFQRGASTGGPGQAQFEADFAGNISDTDLATIPEQQGVGVTYTECRAAITASDATTETITVTAVSPAGTPTVQLVGTAGSAARLSGPAPGAASPSGTVWVFARGAALGGDGQAQFRAVLSGAQSDDDYVSVPEQGRDTLALAVRARVTGTSATTVTVRLAVADPYPQGSGSAAINYQASGTGSVSPASGSTVTPQSALTEAGGTYIDYVIARPVFGAGTGRVTFTATANNRISDSDAVDVPEQVRDTTYLASRAKVIATDASTVTVRYAVADPYPQGSGSAAINYQALGTGQVSPGSGGTVTPQSTLNEASGTYIDYVITRGAFASGTGRVTFTATANGRVSDSDAVDIPAQEKTSFGPNLQASGYQSGNNWIINWSGDSVLLKIDNGSYYAPSPSPITVPMNAAGGAAKSYTFQGTKDGVTVTNTITVPAISAIGPPPPLTVTPTPGADRYSISYAGAGVELSVDGGSFSAAPSSPISNIMRDGTEHSYTFRISGAQPVLDTVIVPALSVAGTDTVTPDLTVTPGAMDAYTQQFTVSASNPSGGVAPDLKASVTGCSASVGGTAGTPGAGPFDSASNNVWNTAARDFNDGAWGNYQSNIQTGAAADPAGNAGAASRLYETTSNSTHVRYRSVQGTSGQPSCPAYYVKTAERSQCAIEVNDNGFTYAVFDLNAGTVISNNTGGVANITPIGNGYYEVSVGHTHNNSQVTYALEPALNGSYSYGGDGSSGIYVAGAQAELNRTTPSFQMFTPGTGGTQGAPITTDTPIGNGAVVTINRPAYAGVPASITFRASLSGGGAEIVQRTISNQINPPIAGISTNQANRQQSAVALTMRGDRLPPGGYSWALYKATMSASSGGNYFVDAQVGVQIASGSNGSNPLPTTVNVTASADKDDYYALIIKDNGGSQVASDVATVLGTMPAIGSGGGIIRNVPMDGGGYAAAATNSSGTAIDGGAYDSRGNPLNNDFRYAGDDANGVNPTTGRNFIDGGYIDGSNRPVSVYRNGGIDSVNNYFRYYDNADGVSPSSARTFIAPSYVNSGYAPIAINRNGALDSTNNLFRNGDSADSIGTSGARTFIAPSYVNSSLQPINVQRAGTLTSVDNLAQINASAIYPSQFQSGYVDATFTFRAAQNFSTINAGGSATVGGQVRAGGWYSGGGGGLACEMGISGGGAYIISYNRDAAQYGILNFEGTSVNVTNGTFSTVGAASFGGAITEAGLAVAKVIITDRDPVNGSDTAPMGTLWFNKTGA